MDRILKERLVNQSVDDHFCFTLTCMVCGNNWRSTPIPIRGKKEQYQKMYHKAQEMAHQEAGEYFAICRLCQEPICPQCYVRFENMTVCRECANKIKVK